jgi:hypothetical protein
MLKYEQIQNIRKTNIVNMYHNHKQDSCSVFPLLSAIISNYLFWVYLKSEQMTDVRLHG